VRISLLLDMATESFADRVALGTQGDGLSYAQLRVAALNARRAIEQHPGRVAYLGLNSRSFAVALFASSLAGRPFVPLNFRLTDDVLTRLVERTAPCVLVVDDDMADRVPEIAGVVRVPRTAFEALYSDGTPSEGESDGDDAAILLFTSGTTGEPKAAMLRHSNLLSYVISTIELGSAEEDEAALVSVPPYHIAGISALLTGTYAGRRIVYLPVFSAEDWISLAAAESVTHAMVVPTMLQRIVDELELQGRGLPALRTLSYGGGRMPLSVVQKAMRVLPHVDFVNAYGLTETSSTIAILSPDDHRTASSSSDEMVAKRLGSVGKPLPHLELQVRDHQGNVQPPGSPGEVFVRGEQISGEYVGHKTVRDDGWFPTKDMGWLDADGYLFIEGRLDDVIVRGGENISPGEIEDVLRSHADVADAAVFGSPDDQWGERIVAVVVRRGTVSESVLRDLVRQQLRSTKTPDAVHFSDSLPYNETGKLLRRELRKQYR